MSELVRTGCELSRYWNGRGDPLDWKRVRPAAELADWQRAAQAFLGPDTLEALDALGDLRGERVLELACGTGQGTVHLVRRGASVVAVDLAERRLAAARQNLAQTGAASCAFAAARAERLPFASASFERLFACDLLMYAERDAVARECARVLAPGGRAVFIESLAGNPLVALYRRLSTPLAYRRFTRHLTLGELGRLGHGLRLVTLHAHYFVASAAIAALFLLGSERLHRNLLGRLEPLDRRLLARFPRLGRQAWRGVAVYEREEPVA